MAPAVTATITAAQREVAAALEACGGDKDAALLLLGHLLNNAKRGLSSGLLRMGANGTVGPAGRP